MHIESCERGRCTPLQFYNRKKYISKTLYTKMSQQHTNIIKIKKANFQFKKKKKHPMNFNNRKQSNKDFKRFCTCEFLGFSLTFHNGSWWENASFWDLPPVVIERTATFGILGFSSNQRSEHGSRLLTWSAFTCKVQTGRKLRPVFQGSGCCGSSNQRCTTLQYCDLNPNGESELSANHRPPESLLWCGPERGLHKHEVTAVVSC